MRVCAAFLLIILLTAVPCFGDLLLLTESSLASQLDEQALLEPEFGAMLGWDTYNFISESISLFLESLGHIRYNTIRDEVYGELNAAIDVSYRSENFLVRLGVESVFMAETNQEIYLDLLPGLYLSYGTIEYTIFTSHTISYLLVESLIAYYEARAGLAFSLDTLLNKPMIGVGVDLENADYPLYLIAEYELSWYPDPLLSFEFATGVHWFLTEDEYQHYFAELEVLWYFSDDLILTLGVSADIMNSGLYPQPELKLEPQAELGIALTESSILSIGVEGTIYIMESYLDEPSLLRFVVRFSYLL